METPDLTPPTVFTVSQYHPSNGSDKIILVTSDSSLSLVAPIQSISKPCWFYLQNTHRIQPLPISTPFIQVQATVISHLDDWKIHVSVSCFCPCPHLHPQSIRSIATRVIIWKSASDHITLQLNTLQQLLCRAQRASTKRHALESPPDFTQCCPYPFPQSSSDSLPPASINKSESSCPRAFVLYLGWSSVPRISPLPKWQAFPHLLSFLNII